MRTLIFIAALLLPISAHAAGSDFDSPPKETKTTKVCKNGTVWDSTSKKCVSASHKTLDDEIRLSAARELSYDGQYDNSNKVLAAVTNQNDSRVLTYYGFNNRKAGRINEGHKFYTAALKADPNNLLARSYMGQGYVAEGKMEAAIDQLVEIRARGGKGSWPEVALYKAIDTGKGYNY